LPLEVQLTVWEEHDAPVAEQLLPLVETDPFEQLTVVDPVTEPAESVIVVLLPLEPPE
jgi:hypothetical protein